MKIKHIENIKPEIKKRFLNSLEFILISTLFFILNSKDVLVFFP